MNIEFRRQPARFSVDLLCDLKTERWRDDDPDGGLFTVGGTVIAMRQIVAGLVLPSFAPALRGISVST